MRLVRDLRKSRDANRRKSHAVRVDILPEVLLRAQDGRRSNDFRVL